MNSRLLTALSDDLNDKPVLRPNHFLIGQMGGDSVPKVWITQHSIHKDVGGECKSLLDTCGVIG